MNRTYLSIASLALCMLAGAPKLSASQHGPSMSMADTLELPFFDDFSYLSTKPDAALWKTSNTFISTNMPDNPPSTGALMLDALDGSKHFYANARYSTCTAADTIETQPINLDYPGDKSIWLSFYYQRGGLGDCPEKGDSLFLEFYSPTEKQWCRIKSYEGGKCEPFRQEMINITDRKFLQNGFKMRFRNMISLGSGLAPDLVSNCDYWMIDYITLDRNRHQADTVYNDVALTMHPEIRVGDYQNVPWKHYMKAEPRDRQLNYCIRYRNNDSRPRLLDSINMYIQHKGDSEKYALGSYNMPSYMDFENVNSSFDYAFGSEDSPESEYSIEVRLVSDVTSSDYGPNNSLTVNKQFKDYYAYDDGTAEAAYGLHGEGSSGGLVAVMFHPLATDYLSGVNMYFCPVYRNMQATNFCLKMWSCHNGMPLAEIFSMENVAVPKDKTEEFIYIPFPELVEVRDTFFIGWEKNENSIIAAGFDKNTTSINPKFYNIGGQWKKSAEKGQIMIRPVFGRLETPTSELAPNPDRWGGIKIFPNPAQTTLHVELGEEPPQPIRAQIIDMAGRPARQVELQGRESVIGLEGLKPGSYILFAPQAHLRQRFVIIH